MLTEIAPDSYHKFQPSAWILAEGEDAHEFLQSQFSNDLSNLEVGSSIYGLWLDQKGKVHGDSWILRTDEESFYLFSYFSPAVDLIEKLEKFIVADDVELEDESSKVSAVSLFGAAVDAYENIEKSEDSEVQAYRFSGRRGVEGSLDVIVANSDFEPIARSLRNEGIVVSVDDSVIELQRILSEIPRVPVDIGAGELPQEGGLEKEGVSFTKGCYLGQEVMSRLHSMGQARRSLRLIESKTTIPYDAVLIAEGKKVGVAKTSIKYQNRFVGLALISKAADDSAPFEIEGGGSGRVFNWGD